MNIPEHSINKDIIAIISKANTHSHLGIAILNTLKKCRSNHDYTAIVCFLKEMITSNKTLIKKVYDAETIELINCYQLQT